MFTRYLNLPLYCLPPETGGDGGSTENVAASSGSESAGSDGSVTSGTASDALIKAAMASESSSGESTTETEAEAVARATGTVANPQGAAGAGKSGTTEAAKGPQHTTGQPAKAQGPVPFDRHEAAVKNAREAGAAEALAPLAWAKDLNQESVATAFSLASEILQDTPAFLAKLAAEVGMKVVPIDAKETASGAKAGAYAPPKGKLVSEDGTEAFSRDQVLEVLENFATTLRTEMSGQLKPLLSDREKAEQRTRNESIVNEARSTASATMADMRKLPYFQMDQNGQKIDNPKILTYLEAIPKAERIKNPVAAFYRAYNTFMEKDILPNVGALEANRIKAENQRKAAASSSVQPGASGLPQKRAEITSVSALARRMEEMAAAGTTTA